jgi:hypothetical protein
MKEEFQTRLNIEIENIKVEHVQELETLVQEFDKAKNFLKKEISNLKVA